MLTGNRPNVHNIFMWYYLKWIFSNSKSNKNNENEFSNGGKKHRLTRICAQNKRSYMRIFLAGFGA